MRYSTTSLAENIRTGRNKLNLNKLEFARKIDISSGLISDYENGVKNPSLETLIKIATLFECSVDDLIKPPETLSLAAEPEEPYGRESTGGSFSLMEFHRVLGQLRSEPSAKERHRLSGTLTGMVYRLHDALTEANNDIIRYLEMMSNMEKGK